MRDKILEAPNFAYIKYWVGEGRFYPWVDDDACIAVVEFRVDVTESWIDEHFNGVDSALLECRCNVTIAITSLEEFKLHHKKGFYKTIGGFIDDFQVFTCCLDRFDINDYLDY